jgi:glutathione S-transferase
MGILHLLDAASSTLASTARGWRGTFQRAQLESAPDLVLYEFEGCPYCRFVREAISELQLDVTIYPCPRNGRYREQAWELAGRRTTFPFLVDRTADVAVAESADIVEHLWETYAGKSPPLRTPFAVPTSALASLARGYRGSFGRTAREPEQLLTLYSFESSPFCRIVRERLCELQLPYRLVSLAKEQTGDVGLSNLRLGGKDWEPVPGGRREMLRTVGGKIQVPYLVDPNTGVSMYESSDIVAYLDDTYAT